MKDLTRRAIVPALLALVVAAAPALADTSAGLAAISESSVQSSVGYLASDELQGRGSGAPGGALAGDWLADQLEALGVPPAGLEGTYFQPFEAAGQHLRNVLGALPGREPGEAIVIGAHYDHLGLGHQDGSLEFLRGRGKVHNGADDNASGTAGLLAVAEALRAAPPRRTVLFVAFGAEESGLLGSQALLAHLPVARERVVAMLNMDMIGRLRDQPLLVGGAGTATEWPAIIQAAADATGATLRTQQDGLGPSDHATFYGAGVPVFFLWTGTHEDYHKPTDDADKIDAKGAETVARVGLALVRGVDALERRPTFTKVARAEQPRRVVTGERGAYFGSIPNYAQEGLQGVLLDGAREGTPAAKAGVQKGDVIVEFAGQQVRTIQDYVNALRLSRPGQTVKVVVLRDGQRVELTATLEGR